MFFSSSLSLLNQDVPPTQPWVSPSTIIDFMPYWHRLVILCALLARHFFLLLYYYARLAQASTTDHTMCPIGKGNFILLVYTLGWLNYDLCIQRPKYDLHEKIY